MKSLHVWSVADCVVIVMMKVVPEGFNLVNDVHDLLFTMPGNKAKSYHPFFSCETQKCPQQFCPSEIFYDLHCTTWWIMSYLMRFIEVHHETPSSNIKHRLMLTICSSAYVSFAKIKRRRIMTEEQVDVNCQQDVVSRWKERKALII